MERAGRRDVADVFGLAADQARTLLGQQRDPDALIDRSGRRAGPCRGRGRRGNTGRRRPVGGRAGGAHGRRGGVHRLDRVLVPADPCQRAIHPGADLGVARVRVPVQQVGDGHDHARRREAVLGGELSPEGILDRMQAPVRTGHPLDGGDFVAGSLWSEDQAALHGGAIEVDRASAALAGFAADLGTRQAEPVTEHIHEQRPWLDIDRTGRSVDRQRNVHVPLRSRPHRWSADPKPLYLSPVKCALILPSRRVKTSQTRRTPALVVVKRGFEDHRVVRLVELLGRIEREIADGLEVLRERVLELIVTLQVEVVRHQPCVIRVVAGKQAVDILVLEELDVSQVPLEVRGFRIDRHRDASYAAVIVRTPPRCVQGAYRFPGPDRRGTGRGARASARSAGPISHGCSTRTPCTPMPRAISTKWSGGFDRSKLIG